MSEKSHTFGVKVSAFPQPLIPFRLKRGRMPDMDLRLNSNLENAQSLPTSQPASREMILQLIEALKEL